MTCRPQFWTRLKRNFRPRGVVLLTLALAGLILPGCQNKPGREPTPSPRAPESEQHGGRASATRFSIQRQGGQLWFVSPMGQPFFSRGVCVVNRGFERGDFDPENPGYAAWRHYPEARDWGVATLSRLQEWGFTTIGAWSDYEVFREAGPHALWLTPVLHLGATVGAPWWDMWDNRLLRRMEELARVEILRHAGDPRVLGYYSDNELGWWNATLWKMTLEQAPSSGQRARLLELLERTYAGDWGRLREDFEVENASGWRELQRGGMLYLRPGGNGVRVQRAFLGVLASRYYQLAHDLIRKYDPGALVLGDRCQSFYYPEVVQAASPWVDVVSSNVNASWNDGGILRCQLATLHQLTQKPILVGEYYLAADENRSGNRNSHGFFPTAATQALRAAGATNTLSQLARLPWVVGADWFQYFDEPRHGRSDGEDFNFGLVDIDNQPYGELTAAFKGFDADSVHQAGVAARLDASGGIPPAPPDPFADWTPGGALQGWDRERGFVPPTSPFPLADLYICWSPDALHLGLTALDVTEDAFYRDKRIPKTDRALWSVRVEGQAPFHARIGAGRQPVPGEPGLRLENLSGVNLTVRNIAAVELPARRLGRERFNPGDHVEIASTFSSHLGAYQVEWRGSFVLAE